MINLTSCCLLAATVLSLAGCGKSQDARKTEAVQCHGFMTAMLGSAQDVENSIEFRKSYSEVAEAHLKGREAEIDATEALGAQLSAQMDATKSAAAQQDGGQSFLGFLKAKDGQGAAAYVENCIANHDKLLAAAR